MNRNTNATCSNCIFAAIILMEDGKTLHSMWCRKNAVIATSSEQSQGKVNPDYWCGEHPDFLLPEEPKQ